MTSPLAGVQRAIAEGAVSRADIARRAHCTLSTVDAAIGHLERLGRLHREVLPSGCASGSCASCLLGHADGHSCGMQRRGPVMLVLGRRG